MAGFFTEHLDSFNDTVLMSNLYKTILPMYRSNNKYLLRNGFSQLKKDMSFTQIRFYCFKKVTGRVLHIMTNKNTKGADVLRYFTSSSRVGMAKIITIIIKWHGINFFAM